MILYLYTNTVLPRKKAHVLISEHVLSIHLKAHVHLNEVLMILAVILEYAGKQVLTPHKHLGKLLVTFLISS